MKLAFALIAPAALALAACQTTAGNIAQIAANVANAAPQTCAALQTITGNLSTFAGEVSAANSSNVAVQRVVGKINAGSPLVNADCTALAALAPTVAAGATLGVTIGGQVGSLAH